MTTKVLWRELGANMRSVRQRAGLSLRQVEADSGWRRGTLSLAENGKARPSWELVRWYDDTFGADGLLLTTYLEARSAVPEGGRGSRAALVRPEPGDAGSAELLAPPCGALAEPGQELCVRWRVRNTGIVPWRDRRLARIGAHSGTHVLHSPTHVEFDAVAPGADVEGAMKVCAPERGGTYAAYWTLADDRSRLLPLEMEPLCLVLVVAPEHGGSGSPR